MTNAFTFHEVTDKERIEIEAKAKSIMEGFSEKLEGVELGEEILIERDDCEREEEDVENDSEFRNRIFKNAPNARGDFIVAEKKSWK